jgi:hypothetical protein
MARHKIVVAAALCAATFIVILAIAAYFDPSIRVLHLFESLPYLLAAILCLRHARSGYAFGMVSGAFWLWTAGFRTTFIRNGFEQLSVLLRTGTVHRADILIAVPAALATAGLVVFSSIGYARSSNKSSRDLRHLALAVVTVPIFFILIFAVFAPQYLAMFPFLSKR